MTSTVTDPTPFEEITVRTPHPMVIVTSSSGGERHGCLVGFHTRCSIDPARYLVCLSPENRTFAVAADGDAVVVHHLGAHQEELARLFGEQTGDEVDKVSQCDWTPGPDGLPVLGDVDNWWAGLIVAHVTLGDHVGFVLEPFAGRVGDRHPPFTSDRAATFEAGHPRD